MGAFVTLVLVAGCGGVEEAADTPAATTVPAPSTAPNAPTAAPASTTAAPTTTAKPATTTTAKPGVLYPGRPDAQKEDQERALGQPVMFSGYTTTVTAGSYVPRLSQFETKGYVVADVRVENRDTKAQAFNLLDWKLQTPQGQVLNPTFSTQPDALKSGQLVNGGSVTGKVAFEVGANAKGPWYLIYKPDPIDAARGVWQVGG